MRKRISILILLLITICGYSQYTVLYHKDFKQDYIKSKYTRNEIASDIRFMLHVIKKSHPNFYHSFTESKLQSTIDSTVNALPDSINAFKASLVIGKIAALFNEGHLGLLGNEETSKYFRSVKLKLPYSLYDITDSALIVYKDLSEEPNLILFDTIVSINDIPVCSLIKSFNCYFGGLPDWRKLQVKNQFQYLLFSSNIIAPFKIKAKHNGEIIEFVAKDFLKSPQNNNNNKTKSNFNYKYNLIGADIAYINFYSMSNLQAFKDSLKITFAEIKSKNINNLIVDLRRNGGGSSSLGEHLLTYFNPKPYRLIASMKLKIGGPVKQYFRKKGIPWYWKTFSYIIPSGITWTKNVKIKQDQISEPFFNGNVVVLIGNGTFSSANMLANGIQDFGLATLIGENTAEPCNDYGDMIPFMLPNTQLIARTPYKCFVRANGDRTDIHGVTPNYIVNPSPEDIIQDKDKVLDFAKDFWFFVKVSG